MSRPLFGRLCEWPSFEPVNDTVRGGKSTSSWRVDPRTNIGSFTGLLDITALGGAGFASQSATFGKDAPLSLGTRHETSGLLITFVVPSSDDSRPSTGPARPHRLVVALKEEKPVRRPDGRRESVTVYQFTVDFAHYAGSFSGGKEGDLDKGGRAGEAKEEEQVTVLAKWDEFKPTYRGRPKEDATPLDPSSIYELSFMCRSNFGDQAGPFHFDIVSLAVAGTSRDSQSGSRFRDRVASWFRAVVEVVKTGWARVWGLVTGVCGGGGSSSGAVRLE